jgi:DNA repair photolyase
MKEDVYRYSTALTSQLPFCATPLRLDTYNNCGYGCAYCFAKTRQGFGREQPLKVANPEILKKRLKRVVKGEIASALDEFILRRIPFQLGGMSDPFSNIEAKTGVTLEYIKVLNEFNYPFIISTKGTLLSSGKYLEVIKHSNCYIRFSTTIINEGYRSSVDKKCPPLKDIISCAGLLSSYDLPVSLRFQPIIPGHELSSFDLLDEASKNGVKHISAEYLKVPMDANLKFGSSLKRILSNNPVQHYRSLGAIKSGREFSLPLIVRQYWLIRMFEYARALGLSFGFADNDILHYSDGNSCCGAADIYLKDANFFRGNVLGAIKNKNDNDLILFDELLSHWIPNKKISSYLNSKARISIGNHDIPEWIGYLMKIWSGDLGVFKPSFFNGISNTLTLDEFGLPIYKKIKTEFSILLDEAKSKLSEPVC